MTDRGEEEGGGVSGEQEEGAGGGDKTIDAKDPSWSAQPSEVERQHHMVNHLPPAPWCELCVMEREKDDPHLRSDLREKGKQLIVKAFDFGYMKTTSAVERQDTKMLRLWLLWTQTCFLSRSFH